MANYYIPLNEEPEKTRQDPSLRLKVFCVLSTVLNIAFLLFMFRRGVGHPGDEPRVYSPAQPVLRRKIVKFTRGVADDIPIYERRPSAAVDEAWNALYSVAQTTMSRTEAMQLPNRTWPLLRRPERYIFSLDVFHQLHCLDILRQQLHPGHNYSHVPRGHIRHCIGAIRQALMCSADTSTIVWQWSDELQVAEQRDDVVHVCRDFDHIRDWASKRTFEDAESDFSVYIDDDLPVPPII
ncbi:hypothetical protein FB451DRAFT_1148732 [Mycena latifolia]|nr:hypothetical protein FB451DRAFT_1148732 [Mycena latifolia]